MNAVNTGPVRMPAGVEQIAIPVPYLGTVNVWLLLGDPLTLADAGPGNNASLDALEGALGALGVGLEEIELILLTHHHLDHSGLAGVVAERSGARIAATARTAAWGASYPECAALEREFGLRLLAAHGVPRGVIASSEPFWEHIARNGAPFVTAEILADGAVVRAGDRLLRVVERPGHSATDTLYVDEADGVALVGDHLLAEITSGAEVVPDGPLQPVRRRALAEYLAALGSTSMMPLDLLLPGHGPLISDHRSLIAERLEFHERRLELVAACLDAGGTTAFEVARRVWDDQTAKEQPVLVVWEVIGHLDVLAERGLVEEADGGGGIHVFRPTVTAAAAGRA